MPNLGRLVQLAAAATYITVAAAGISQAAPVHNTAGDCGEYKYWHNGHCMDARTKPGRDWTAGVYL